MKRGKSEFSECDLEKQLCSKEGNEENRETEIGMKWGGKGARVQVLIWTL